MTLAEHFLLFLPILFPFSASQPTVLPVPTITAEISPVNKEVQREGDTVSLLCRVDNFDPRRYLLSWFIAHKPLLIPSSSVPNTQGTYSYRFQRTEPSTSSYIFNLTFNQIELSDNGTYDCNLIEKLPDTSYQRLDQIKLVLRVYPPDAFPICRPVDKSSVAVGSQLQCQTSDAATPTIHGSNDDWKYFMEADAQGQGALLIKSATLSDNGRTYVCSAIATGNRMPLSCNIGPLTVAESLTVSTFSAGSEYATVTTARTSISNAGLSAAAISGIVSGAIVLIILIAIHALCCHCNPRKWMNAKSYLVNLGSSIGTWNQGTDSTRRQSEVEMVGSHPEEPDSPPAYNAGLNYALGESHDFVGGIRPVSKSDPNIYAESSVAVPNLSINIDLRLNMNTHPANVASTSGAVDQPPPARKDPSVKIPTGVSHATVSSADGGRLTQNMPRETAPAAAYAAVKPSPIPQIYAEVTNPRRGASENIML